MTYPEITDEYERYLIAEQERTVRYIERQYTELMGRVAPILASTSSREVQELRINALLEEYYTKINGRVIKGVQQSWQISNEKTVAYLDKRLKGVDIPENVTKVWYDPNEKALRQFTDRKQRGMTLSSRVWNTLEGVNKTIEAIQAEGISKGEGSAKIARRLREELRNPTLTEAPGKGVYRSPLANTTRLTRTETNRAYRMADHYAWLNNPTILGYEIKLSATQSKKVKARCELCVQMQGKYPVDFVWAGWHPNCLCYKTPILMTREQLNEYQRMIAQGRDSERAVAALRRRSGVLKEPPAAFGTWVRDNKERVKGWANKPYWMLDNPKVVKRVGR